MLKALIVAILFGLASGRPWIPSGQELNILESRDLIYVFEEVPNVENPLIAQLEEIQDLQPPLQGLLRSKRDVQTTVMDYIGRFTVALTNVLLVPIEAILSLISNLVVSSIRAIFGLLAGILNPILELLTELLNPILKPLRPLLNPILSPINSLLIELFKALHLPISLSGLLTGNTTSLIFLPSAIATTNSSPSSSSNETEISPVPPGAQIPPIVVSGIPAETLNDTVPTSTERSDPSSATSVPDPIVTPFDLSLGRRRRASSPLPVTDVFTTSRNRRQSIDPSFSSGFGSIAGIPLLIARNIASAIKNVILFPFKVILRPIFALLHIPINIISLPFDFIGSIVSAVTSPIRGIIRRIVGPIRSLLVGVIDLELAFMQRVVQLFSGILSIPSTIASNTLRSVAVSATRRKRDAASTISAGPLNVFLSILSAPLKILSSYLASLLGNFNISYASLKEAARVLFSNAAKRFLVMAYNAMKDIILPGVDNFLQSIVGSEYIPDYLNNAIAQFHTFYRLIRLMGYLRPS